MSAAAKAKLSSALKGKHHKGHRESAATRAKIAAKLRADAMRRGKKHAVKAKARAKAKAKARLAKAHRKRAHVNRHRGTTFGAHRKRLNKRGPHYIHHRRTTGKVVHLSRLHKPHPQRISRHHRLASLSRRRRKGG